MAKVRLSKNRLEAYLSLEPGERLSPVEAMALLTRHDVSHGILTHELVALAEREGPLELCVAVGEPAVHGRDARLSYYFCTDPPTLAPIIVEGDRADYLNLGLVESVQPGQVLATREGPRSGRDGVTVCGERVVAHVPRNRSLKSGEGCVLTDDGSHVIATIAGCPSLEGGKVVVRRRYRVNGSVGLATGNIHFDGDLEILGDVAWQMAVSATGRVIVAGSVLGACVQAGSDLVVHGKALAGAVLEAGGNLTVGLGEYARLHSGGDLAVRDGLLHCTAIARGCLKAGGSLVGGSIQAGIKVTCRALGAPKGVRTRVLIDPESTVREALTAIDAARAELRFQLGQLSALIRVARAQLAPGRTDKLRQLIAEFSRLTAEDTRLAAEEGRLRADIPRALKPVEAREVIHPEVEIRLGESGLAVSEGHWPALPTPLRPTG